VAPVVREGRAEKRHYDRHFSSSELSTAIFMALQRQPFAIGFPAGYPSLASLDTDEPP
jgi:hypothetical protein